MFNVQKIIIQKNTNNYEINLIKPQSKRKIETIKSIYELKGYQELVNYIEKGIQNSTYNYIKHEESKLIAFLKDNLINKVLYAMIHTTRMVSSKNKRQKLVYI